MSATDTAPASLGNTSQSYGSIAKTFHWLTALLILSLIPMGWIAEQMPYGTSAELARKAFAFSLHKTLGILVFLVALLRILWAVSQPKPGLLHADRKLESFAADLVHWLLYGALVLVPLSGWIHHAASQGFAPVWLPFGDSLPLVPKSEAVSEFFAAWHKVFTKLLIVAVLLHIAGAMKHHIIDRDDTLRRMLPGRTAPMVPPQAHDRKPLFAAATLWGLAIALGTVLGMQTGDHAQAPAAAALEAVPSGWTVQDGRLDIAVMQMGSEVSGRFADWTAAIDFDPEATGPEMGDVTVQIAIPSLTLGSVTGEAMKPEFFDAEAHPTATFAATILREGDGYVADGMLSLKGTEAPLRLPFDLSIEGDTARMTGTVTLDRRDFGVGTTQYDDEKTVAFPVAVTVALTATRGAPAAAAE